VIGGTGALQKATITLELEDKTHVTKESSGDGPVDAAFNAIKLIVGDVGRLVSYQVSSVTGGTDAQAEVTVRLEDGERSTTGSGADTDTIVASGRAYINAVNKMLVKQKRGNPSAMSA